jgi:hypothetical protein
MTQALYAHMNNKRKKKKKKKNKRIKSIAIWSTSYTNLNVETEEIWKRR